MNHSLTQVSQDNLADAHSVTDTSTTNRHCSPVSAILLDRDGVINYERADYVKNWSEFQFLPGVLPALSRLATLPVPIVVVTNQSAIGRGIISQETVIRLHEHLTKAVVAAGGRLDGFFVCPHHPAAGCACRKPKPGLLVQAAQTFHFDLTQAVFIGDAVTDFAAACAAGCQSILVKSGRQGATLDEYFSGVAAPPLVADLLAAVKLLL